MPIIVALMNSARILVIEDEKKIARLISDALAEDGFSVDVSYEGTPGLAMAVANDYDLLILDIMLPDLSGLDILKRVRRGGSSLPVIMLTARHAIEDRVEGLDGGADDYVTKPFYIEELKARINAQLRRASERSDVVVVHGISINRKTGEVFVGKEKLNLTGRERALLELLMRTPGNVYTRPEILEKVWELHFDPTTNLVEVYVRRLRTKLADAGAPDVIETVRGVGYRISASREPAD